MSRFWSSRLVRESLGNCWDLVTSCDPGHLIEKVIINSRVQRWDASPRNPDGELTIPDAIRSLQHGDERYDPPSVQG